MYHLKMSVTIVCFLGKTDTGIYDCNLRNPQDGTLIGIKKFNVTSKLDANVMYMLYSRWSSLPPVLIGVTNTFYIARKQEITATIYHSIVTM